MTGFTELGLAAPILKALETQGYTTPTPIQAQAIPPVLTGRDLLGIAQTGTGKTAAFALPIINRLLRNTLPRKPHTCRALILSPTRELATQIADSFRAYSANTGLTITTVFGGVGHRPQQVALARGVDIVVATPGRLLDHMGERNIGYAETEVFVLDEADQMLDLGFLPAIRRIVGQLPKVRQNLFFSATMPADIGKLASDLLRDPVRVAVTPVATTVERVSQRVIHVESHKKKSLLVELFADPDLARALVFTRTKRGADRVARHLETAGVGVAAIHGNKSQGQREKALAAFRAAKIRVLVATDIAARGIDIDDVSHVINYELPDVPESYVHRIGRTARAGRAGVAISFCDHEEREQLRDIERLTRQAIVSEDRRNDANLSGEKREGSRGQLRNGGGDRRQNGRRHEHKGSDRNRHDRQGRQGGHSPQHGGRAEKRDDQQARGQRHERGSQPQHQGKPRYEDDRRNGGQRPAQQGGHARPQSRGAEDERGGQGQAHNLANVAFLKQPTGREGSRQGERPRHAPVRHMGKAGAR